VARAITVTTADGALMNAKTRENGEFQRTGWVVVSASLLLLISAGLELFVQQTLGDNSVATVLLALFLALWSYVLGIGGLLFLAMWWLVEWRRVRVKRAAMSRNSTAGSRIGHLEQPELRDPQYPQRDMAPNAPSRSSSGESNNGNETSSLTRVA
jgi:hypothetical protein